MYSVNLSVKVQKFLDSLDKHVKERIESSLKRLEDNPVPNNSKFIGREEGEKVFRYRVGNYRALYSVDEENKIILIVKLDKRSKVYD
jgi:mRNA interferase RelE/StbE